MSLRACSTQLCALLAQEDEGNVEYKYRIKDPHPGRLQQLVGLAQQPARAHVSAAAARCLTTPPGLPARR
jgi:hypothetical protein